ncbi:hypothetical protein G4B88_024676 [Cannabis sativa]|uniref:Uncharacterized protein n=1 Tax=Cannabis sativa TaxID=3483 RepID=A0A7J6GVZ2_CANSA|nr:hypothetical protein G4B88_024676 [Cannabis sativa]
MSKKVKFLHFGMKSGNVELKKFKYKSSSDNWVISNGISPSISLSLKSNKVSLVRLPMAGGMEPESLQLLRLKTVMIRNGVKLKLSNFPLSSKLERSICEISPLETSQTTLVQLQRLMMLLLSHESREDGSNTKLFFHVMRASACVVGEQVIFNGSQTKYMTMPKLTTNTITADNLPV